MQADWLILIGATYGALMPITNPFSAAPVFAALTQRFSETHRRQQARKAAIHMTWVLLTFLFAGALVLELFGISLPILRLAGGLLVARVGFTMLNPDSPQEVSDEGEREALDKEDISFTPIAMPLLSGPGSIAVTIGMATQADGLSEYFAVCVGIILVAFSAWLVLRSASGVVRVLGVTGMQALTRIMGLILVCVGIEFVVTGLFQAITDPLVMGGLVDAVREAS